MPKRKPENEPDVAAVLDEPKPKRGRAKKAKLELVREPESQAAQEPASAEIAPEPATEPAAEPKAPKRARQRKDEQPITLGELVEKYLASLEADGKSGATQSAYKADLGVAIRILGADTPITSVTPQDVQRFNESDEVLLTRAGTPKAAPSYLRTQRVLRLCFDFAEAEAFVVTTPCVEPAPEPEA